MAIPTKRYLTMKKDGKDEGLIAVKQMILKAIGKELPYFNCNIIILQIYS